MQSLVTLLSLMLVKGKPIANIDELIEVLVELMNHPSANVRKTMVLLMVDLSSTNIDKRKFDQYLKKFSNN